MSDAGNAPKLRDKNLRLYKENLQIQKELDESRKSLEAFEAWLKAQGEKDASIIRDLESTLRVHLEEIAELDTHILGMPFFHFLTFA